MPLARWAGPGPDPGSFLRIKLRLEALSVEVVGRGVEAGVWPVSLRFCRTVWGSFHEAAETPQNPGGPPPRSLGGGECQVAGSPVGLLGCSLQQWLLFLVRAPLWQENRSRDPKRGLQSSKCPQASLHTMSPVPPPRSPKAQGRGPGTWLPSVEGGTWPGTACPSALASHRYPTR